MTAIALSLHTEPIMRFGFGDRIAPPQPRNADTASAFGTAMEPEWVSFVLQRIGHLIDLQDDWDGHGGRSVRLDTAHFAFSLLTEVLWPSTPCPEIMPLPYGGLQIEWHESGIDLEIEIVAPNEVYLSFEDAVTDEANDEVPLGINFSGLEDLINRLTTRQFQAAAE